MLLNRLLICLALFFSGGILVIVRGYGSRSGRVFSLFNTVKFKNEHCIGQDNQTGICLSSSDCNEAKGFSVGSCASGFGTCCQIVLTECGAEVTRNTTLIQNRDFPSTTNTGHTCVYFLNRKGDDICHIRLDFKRLEVALPDVDVSDTDLRNGDCKIDRIEFQQGTQIQMPTICGKSNGMHMYLDTGRGESARTMFIRHVFTGTATNRIFQYKVSYIPCGVNYEPPPHCLQYFMGTSGRVRNYNFEGNFHLNLQEYNACFRQEAGYCLIQYTPTELDRSFKTFLKQNVRKAFTGSAKCTTDFLIIPKGKNAEAAPLGCLLPGAVMTDYVDRYCGGSLSCINEDRSDFRKTVISHAGPPFLIHFHSNLDDPATQMGHGFDLYWQQIAC